MNFYLLPTLEFGPLVVRRLLHQIPASRLDEALVEGRFTPREVIAHLADWEPILRERIEAARTEPGTVIQVWDEGQMALDHGYARTDPEEQCALFIRERSLTAALVRGLAAEDWGKTVQHPERGVQSVDDMANLILGHDLYHIEQLSAFLPEQM